MHTKHTGVPGHGRPLCGSGWRGGVHRWLLCYWGKSVGNRKSTNLELDIFYALLYLRNLVRSQLKLHKETAQQSRSMNHDRTGEENLSGTNIQKKQYLRDGEEVLRRTPHRGHVGDVPVTTEIARMSKPHALLSQIKNQSRAHHVANSACEIGFKGISHALLEASGRS